MAQQNIIGAPYIFTTHSTTFTWGAHTTGSFTIRIKKLGSEVSLQLPIINISSTQNGTIVSNTALPSQFRPSVDVWGLNFCTLAGGAAAKCLFLIQTSGIINFKTDEDAAISSTAFGLRPPAITYIIQT